MRPAVRSRRRAVLVAVLAAACGPYADVAQKLDVTTRVAGDTWIARGGPDEIRVLLVGKPSSDGSAPFSFSSLVVKISAGNSVSTLQGTWVEVGNAGTAKLDVEHEYSYPDEATTPLGNRMGTTRSDDRFQIALTVTRNAGQLVVAGDARLSGTYVALTEALGRLGTTSGPDAACAFQIANVGMLRSEGRIITFGGAGITQYMDPERYIGTVAGSLEISAVLSGGSPIPSHATVTIRYSAFEDIGGVVVDGPMVTDSDGGGNGAMSGRMTFTFSPTAADGTPGTPIAGWIDYGGDATPWGTYDPANAIQIQGGNPFAGVYTVAIYGDGPAQPPTATAQVPTAQAPNPTLAECLSLP